jgi:hypothetical protein
VWRLGKLPNVEEITTLISNKIITNEEAREILFNTRTVEERDKNSLEAEIKFLRDLVEKLSQNRTQIVEVIKQVSNPIYIHDYWYKQYDNWKDNIVLCQSTNSFGSVQASFNSIQTF